ncbi:MAG: DUF1320 domain-containing protein [Deferribacteraceae bacterium]|jgi:phage gp36-like protein|nr:DUF1320 domain-containing protein [Deferribacteraceae bacterium]
MPIYATFEDMLSEIPEYRLAEYVDENIAEDGLSEPALELVDNALLSASELITSYIQLRYPQPNSSEMLKKICTAIALSYLVERKHTGEPEMSGWARAFRAEQLKLLEAIRDGTLSLGMKANDQASGFKMRVAERKSMLGNVLNEG